MVIGQIQKLPFRQAFLYGASSRTAWLEKNLQSLSERVQISLFVEDRELFVEDFGIDLICLDPQGNRVLVKFERDPQDEKELLQLTQYMDEIGANTTLWITPTPYPKHLETITYLNSMTTNEYQFFLIKVEAIRIGDSAPAPLFSVVAHPGGKPLLLEEPILEPQRKTPATIPVTPMQRAGDPLIWCVNPRRDHETHTAFIKEQIIGLSISRLGDLSQIEPSPLGFKKAYQDHDAFAAEDAVSTIYHTLYSFVHEATTDDYVIYAPLWLEERLYVGKITSVYQHSPNHPARYTDWRSVSWVMALSPEKAFTPEALRVLNSQRAFFRIRSNTFTNQLLKILS